MGRDGFCTLVSRTHWLYRRTATSPTITNMPARDFIPLFILEVERRSFWTLRLHQSRRFAASGRQAVRPVPLTCRNPYANIEYQSIVVAQLSGT